MKIQKNCALFAIALLALIALIGSAQAAPNITVIYDDPEYVFSDLTNVMIAYVENSGDVNATDFNVSIEITNTTHMLYTHKATGVSVVAGATKEVSLGTWKPTKVENITINVTADCDNTTAESNETDNSRIENRNTTGDCDTDTMLPSTCYGYRGQYPLTEAYVGEGNVIYTVGDYKYKNNTVNFTIGASGGDINEIDGNVADIPDGATVKKAILYMYYCWRDNAVYGYPDLGMQFTNSTGTYAVAEDANYTDWKGWTTKTYYGYGTIVYNVTTLVIGNGTYTANITNTTGFNAWKKGYASGMALMVIYNDGSSMAYRVAHGYDRLATSYKTGMPKHYQYWIVPEDATTTATLTDANPSNDVTYARLFTATLDSEGSAKHESLKFNSGAWTDGAWSNGGRSGTNYPIGMNRQDVTADISASGSAETVYFQERNETLTNGFSAVFAMLAITKVEAAPIFDTDSPENPYPSIMGRHNGTITPNQTISVSKLYTYPCTGTGGHSESVAFYNATTGVEIANGTWKGYGVGDYHYIELNMPFDLQANVIYNYTIRTGSYPQIFHNKTLATANGWINCTKFTDANGKEYTDWIPAIRLGE